MRRRDFLKTLPLVVGANPLRSLAAGAPDPPSSDDADDLFDQFRSPEMRYRPMVRWWWNGDRVTANELLRELDVMKAAGIGGVEINPIRFPGDADPAATEQLTWLSKPWLDVLEVVLNGTKARGMTCDMIVGSGWPFGGEFLTRQEQSQMVALGTRNVVGPTRLQLSRAELIKEVSPALVSAYSHPEKQLVGLSLAPAVLNSIHDVQSLDAQVGADQIVVDVPAGKHVLYFLVKLTGYMAVINGAPGADGPVLNHLDKTAVEHYLDHLSTILTERIPDLNTYLRAFFTDSIELEGANWVADLPAVFLQRCGYDLMPWLPLLLFKVGEMGNALNESYGAQLSPDLQRQVEAARYDFQTLKRQLFDERFVRTFAEWCTRLGVKSRMQAYGTECDVMTASTMVDIPECETWITSEQVRAFEAADYRIGRSYTMINKFVSSAAHLSGKQLISCEEMTNTDDPFGTSLNRIKVAGDQSILSGVTQSVLHGFNYSPLDIPFPGWVRYGTYFSERNTWWPYFHLWAAYKARLSCVMQHAVMQADIAILPPFADVAARFGFQRDPFPQIAYPKYLFELWEAVHQSGNGCDYITEEVIRQGAVQQGRLVYNKRAYKALLLPNVTRMHPETVKNLVLFAEGGGILLCLNETPHETAAMTELHDDRRIAEPMHTLLRKYPDRVALVPVDAAALTTWYAALQKQFHLTPYVAIDVPRTEVSQVHYRAGDHSLFFFANYSPGATYRLGADFADIADRTPWLWDATTGDRTPLTWSGQRGTLSFELGPSESKLIVLAPAATRVSGKRSGHALSTSNPQPTHFVPLPVRGDWQVELAPLHGESRSYRVSGPQDPALMQALEHFAGTITYRVSVLLPAFQQAILQLGVLHSVSELRVNSHLVGVRWFGDQQYDLHDFAHPGTNTFEIRLVTTLGNYMKSVPNKTAQDWTRDTPTYDQGLANAVQLGLR